MNCSYCKEEIADDVENCPHCKSQIVIPCPFCREKIKADAVKCKHCGSTVNSGAPQISSVPQSPPSNYQQNNQINPALAQQAKLKSQTVAALLCAFLGGFGVHRFYLGPIWVGIAYLLFFWTGIPGLIATIEVFIIAFSGQESWARKHNNGIITPPAHILVKILVAIIPILVIVGIIAAIAIPQFSAYKNKAHSSIALFEIKKS